LERLLVDSKKGIGAEDRTRTGDLLLGKYLGLCAVAARLESHPKVVQERLGHANIGVTLDTYSHVLPNMQRDAADLLDSMVPAPPRISQGA
jgi:integrase